MNERLTMLYQQINQQGQDALVNHHEQIDHQVVQPMQIGYSSLALISHLPAHVTRNIKMCMQGLQMSVPELYYYHSLAMHITILELVGQRLGRQKLQLCVQRLEPLMKQFLPIKWRLKGIITSPAAIMVCGFYSPELFRLQKLIRHQLQDLGIEACFPLMPGSVVVARFPSPVKHSTELLNFLQQNEQVNFGMFESTELELVDHDRYYQKVQSVATFGGH